MAGGSLGALLRVRAGLLVPRHQGQLWQRMVVGGAQSPT
jgi:hypothetical protein